MILTGESKNTHGKICASATLSSTNHIMTGCSGRYSAEPCHRFGGGGVLKVDIRRKFSVKWGNELA
jgi:hypothetical protein